jgi:excisionase family DNA binding protein
MQALPTESPLLSLQEVALELRCSTDSVRRKIKRRELPVYRLGNGVSAPFRISRDDLDRYLATHYIATRKAD